MPFSNPAPTHPPWIQFIIAALQYRLPATLQYCLPAALQYLLPACSPLLIPSFLFIWSFDVQHQLETSTSNNKLRLTHKLKLSTPYLLIFHLLSITHSRRFSVLVITGGWPGNGNGLASAEVFFLKTGKSCRIHDIPDLRLSHTLTHDKCDGLLLCGGTFTEKSCLSFSSSDGSWSRSPFTLKQER